MRALRILIVLCPLACLLGADEPNKEEPKKEAVKKEEPNKDEPKLDEPKKPSAQSYLDQATQKRVAAQTLADLGEVIDLCQKAIDKGLDSENRKVAEQMLAGALAQRGGFAARAITEERPIDPRWQDWRRLALSDLQRAVKIEPKLVEAQLGIAKLNLLPLGDRKRAGQALDAAIAAGPQSRRLLVEALLLRAELATDAAKKMGDVAEAVRSAPGDPRPLRARALLLYRAQKPEEALVDVEAALKLDPGHVSTLELKGDVLARLKQFDKALAAVDDARRRDPRAISPLIHRSEVHGLQRDFKAALADLEEALKLEPDNIGLLLLRANIYQELKDNDKALVELAAVLERKPDFDLAARLRAMILVSMKRTDQAVEELEKFVKENPKEPEARVQLGLLYTLIKKVPKAMEAFDAVLKEDPDNWGALRARGDTLLGVGKHAEAIADFEKAYKLDPGDSALLNNFAWVLATSPVDAVRNGRRALELATEACRRTEYQQAHILSTLAAACAETGDFAAAVKWSTKSLELAEPKLRPALKKELETYQANRPMRELKTGNEPDEESSATPEPEKQPEPEEK